MRLTIARGDTRGGVITTYEYDATWGTPIAFLIFSFSHPSFLPLPLFLTLFVSLSFFFLFRLLIHLTWHLRMQRTPQNSDRLSMSTKCRRRRTSNVRIGFEGSSPVRWNLRIVVQTVCEVRRHIHTLYLSFSPQPRDMASYKKPLPSSSSLRLASLRLFPRGFFRRDSRLHLGYRYRRGWQKC